MALVLSGRAAHQRIAKRLAPIARWALALVFVLVALTNIVTALLTLPAIPIDQVSQIVDLDEFAWGRAGAIALGLLLLLVARALARGKRQAWLLSLAMLAISLAGALAEHAHARSLILVLVSLMALLALGPAFTRRSDRISSMRGYIALALGGWLTWTHAFLYHALKVGHVTIQLPPWPILVPLRILTYMLLPWASGNSYAQSCGSASSARGEHERATEVVRRHGLLSTAYFALGEDKRYIWSDSGQTLLPYRVVGGVALALSDPIGPAEEHAQYTGEIHLLLPAAGLGVRRLSGQPRRISSRSWASGCGA